MNRETAKYLADAVIGVLLNRGGFDHWWYDIDEEDSESILNEIADVLYAARTGQ